MMEWRWICSNGIHSVSGHIWLVLHNIIYNIRLDKKEDIIFYYMLLDNLFHYLFYFIFNLNKIRSNNLFLSNILFFILLILQNKKNYKIKFVVKKKTKKYL